MILMEVSVSVGLMWLEEFVIDVYLEFLVLVLVDVNFVSVICKDLLMFFVILLLVSVIVFRECMFGSVIGVYLGIGDF